MTVGSTPLREPLRDVAIYNPDLLRKEELVAYFIARRPLLDRILQDLRLSGAAQHHLLIGTRGMGKTTLLKRVRFAVEDDPVLSAAWLPLTFPEEQYSVTRLSDLYLNCVDALSDALEERGRRAEARSLDARVAELSKANEEERSREALLLLLGAADAAGRKLVLLLDNIDILFDRLKSQAWALRELLSREERLVIIGASASHPEETYKYDQPFYDFFKVDELRGLHEDEARELLLHLADLRGATQVRAVVEGQRARVRTMHTLSGGNPRTLVLLFFLLSQSVRGDARDDLERLLDHITPLYKARVEALSAQAQKIVDAIAIHWHPATAADIAARTQLDVGAVSSQITRLVREGVLESCPTPDGSRSAYQIAERLLNIWYLMRQSRRVRQRLVWLVEFLRLFYGSEELSSHARAHLGRDLSGSEERRLWHIEYGLALAEAVNEPPLRKALESLSVREMVADPRLREQIGRIVDIEGADAGLQPLVDKHSAAVEVRRRVLAARGKEERWDAESFASWLGGSLSLTSEEKLLIARALGRLSASQTEELVRIFELERLFLVGAFRSEPLVEALRRALREGHMVGFGDHEGAEAAALVYDAPVLPAVLTRLGGSAAPEKDLMIHLGRPNEAEVEIRQLKVEIRQLKEGLNTQFRILLGYVKHFLAEVLVRCGSWDEARDLMSSVVQQAPDMYFEQAWSLVVSFFAECVRAKRASDAVAMLDAIGFGERWLPLRAALSATIEGRESLLAVAPEMRGPAEKILDDLHALSGVPPAAPRSVPKSRRK